MARLFDITVSFYCLIKECYSIKMANVAVKAGEDGNAIVQTGFIEIDCVVASMLLDVVCISDYVVRMNALPPYI